MKFSHQNEGQTYLIHDFITRMNELGYNVDTDFTIFESTNGNINIKSIYKEHNVLHYKRVVHCILGMVFHFNNRNWITEFSYVYAMKNRISVIFNDGTKETN